MVIGEKSLSPRRLSESAQGMVEFALVLPIFLLVVLGIFVFGHLFFTYTQVVAASREAARFGAAVGLTDNLVPSYRDCDGIRAAAARIGAFSGIDANAVTIEYDQGPRQDGNPIVVHPDGCPIGGVGPGYIELGDRIVVTVTIDYETISPFIDFGTIPMTATTHRTIIVDMPVGVATPSAKDCSGTITRILAPSMIAGLENSYSLVGETVVFKVEVISDDPNVIAPGTSNVRLWVDKDYTDPFDCEGSPPLLDCTLQKKFTFNEVGEHVVLALYESPLTSGTGCFQSSIAQPIIHRVLPADTTTTILVKEEEEPSWLNQFATIFVEVRPVEPGSGSPEGKVIITGEFGQLCEPELYEDQDIPDVSFASCDLLFDTLGWNLLKAVYVPAIDADGKAYYYASEGTYDHEVIYEPGTEPPPVEPPIDPKLCPVVELIDGQQQIDFSTSGSLLMNMRNNTEIGIKMSSISIIWPKDDPISNLVGIKLGPPTVPVCSQDGSCQWSVSPISPPTDPDEVKISKGDSGWPMIGPEISALSTEQLRFDFSQGLPSGDYKIVITFEVDERVTCPAITAQGTKP
jgi:hypothetical protein